MSEQPKNWRFVITGTVLILLALLQTAGTVSGVAIGVATALIVLGLLGKR